MFIISYAEIVRIELPADAKPTWKLNLTNMHVFYCKYFDDICERAFIFDSSAYENSL